MFSVFVVLSAILVLWFVFFCSVVFGLCVLSELVAFVFVFVLCPWRLFCVVWVVCVVSVACLFLVFFFFALLSCLCWLYVFVLSLFLGKL